MRIEIVKYSDYQDEIIRIRHDVFVIGQNVPPDLEIDGKDSECVQVLVWDDQDRPIATGRMQMDGKIGRMAVLQPNRGQGIGRRMLDVFIEHARSNNYEKVYLNSQMQATPFYEKAGFQSKGKIFYEAGIPHVKMMLNL
ncbi:GNAT family N-acetyltransferase [candidate division KSB1 bacterium]|nr:GNAT family N-acetyltransferase [candidate division KSB1 bacterium]